MLKTSEVMTHELVICAPEESVANVVALMRDRDIGNVLVVENGKLRGIVTDRDLALQALTGKDDPLETPVRKFMSTKVVTGKAEWSLEQAARSMAKHQIRRLPIVQDGQLVGIISLGDIARYEERKGVVTKSLQAISAPVGISAPNPVGRGGALLGFAVAASATILMGWLNWSHSGQALTKQIEASKLYHTTRRAVSAAFDKAVEAASGGPVHNQHLQMRSHINDLSV